MLLDAKIRAATNGARSLDDVMRLAFQRYSGARGYTDADFRKTVREVAGVDFGDWWTRTLETTERARLHRGIDVAGPALQAGRSGPAP